MFPLLHPPAALDGRGPGKAAVVLRWGFVPCIILGRGAVKGSASSQHRALLLPRSQICLSKGFASMQELAAESSEVFSRKEAAGWKVAQSRG